MRGGDPTADDNGPFARPSRALPQVRDARADDADAVCALYAHEVLNGYANYEYTPPDAADMRQRMAAIRAAGLPWLVAELDGRFAGYAYASSFRSRAGYRWTVENTVYVHPDAQRRGVGGALLEALIARCTALGYRQMIAVIGDAENLGSIALHRAFGFVEVGTFRGIGWKAIGDGPGRWLDNVQMQRALGPGSDAPPTAPLQPPSPEPG
jgi:L-amino acid N-acyltransferase YncA